MCNSGKNLNFQVLQNIVKNLTGYVEISLWGNSPNFSIANSSFVFMIRFYLQLDLPLEAMNYWDREAENDNQWELNKKQLRRDFKYYILCMYFINFAF